MSSTVVPFRPMPVQFMRVPVKVALPDGSVHGGDASAPCKAFVFDDVLQVFQQPSLVDPVQLIFESPLVAPFDGSFDLVPADSADPRVFSTVAGDVGMWVGAGCACSFQIKRFIPRPLGDMAIPPAAGLVRFRVLNDRRECIAFDDAGKCAAYTTRVEADGVAAAKRGEGLTAIVEGFYARQ